MINWLKLAIYRRYLSWKKTSSDTIKSTFDSHHTKEEPCNSPMKAADQTYRKVTKTTTYAPPPPPYKDA